MDNTDKITFKSFFIIAGVPGYVLLLRDIIMALISRQRNIDEVTTIDTSALIQIIWSVVAFAAGLSAYLKSKNCQLLLFNSPLKWLFLYNIWAFVSILWSVNPVMTTYRAFETMAYLFLLSAVISNLYAKLPIESMIQWVLYYAVFAIVIGVLNRTRQFGMPLFSLDNILLEQMGSTPYFFLALLLPVGWLIRAFILPISIFSLSNTAYAGIAGGLLAFLKGNKWTKALFVSICAAILVALIFMTPDTILKSTIFYGQKGIGVEYTTGRDKIVKLSWEKAMEQPLTGYGFVAGETFILSKHRLGAIGAHDGVLSAMLGTGIFGAILLIIFMIKIFEAANSRYLPGLYRSAFLASAILITAHTMGNPGIGSRVYGTWMPAVIIFTLLCMVRMHYENQQISEAPVDPGYHPKLVKYNTFKP